MIVILSSVAQETKKLETRIESVTVFFSGAKIERTGKISLQPGIYELTLGNLPSNVNPYSIYVDGKGDLTILFVEFRKNFLGDFLLPKVKLLKDLIKLLEKQLKSSNNMLKFLKAE